MGPGGGAEDTRPGDLGHAGYRMMAQPCSPVDYRVVVDLCGYTLGRLALEQASLTANTVLSPASIYHLESQSDIWKQSMVKCYTESKQLMACMLGRKKSARKAQAAAARTGIHVLEGFSTYLCIFYRI